MDSSNWQIVFYSLKFCKLSLTIRNYSPWRWSSKGISGHFAYTRCKIYKCVEFQEILRLKLAAYIAILKLYTVQNESNDCVVFFHIIFLLSSLNAEKMWVDMFSDVTFEMYKNNKFVWWFGTVFARSLWWKVIFNDLLDLPMSLFIFATMTLSQYHVLRLSKCLINTRWMPFIFLFVTKFVTFNQIEMDFVFFVRISWCSHFNDNTTSKSHNYRK